jgi:ribosomal protein S18 acetylase RimI-like enzyme
MVSVREAKPDEWELLRDVRLAALREAPYAFASTYDREEPYPDERWRGWFSDQSVMFFPYVAGSAEPAGLAGVLVKRGAAQLVSMWVRPEARGRGVAGALVSAAAGWAKARGHEAMYLWVAESNTSACRLYERSGFTATGERQPLPSNPAEPEIRMLRQL